MSRRSARVGEQVWTPDRDRALPVVDECTLVDGAWVCSTHRHVAQHNLAASSHEDEPGEHVIYWRCIKHGPEPAYVEEQA